jgi:hypothetical protein
LKKAGFKIMKNMNIIYSQDLSAREDQASFLARHLSYCMQEVEEIANFFRQNPEQIDIAHLQQMEADLKTKVSEIISEVYALQNDTIRGEPIKLKREILTEQKEYQNGILIRVCKAVGLDTALQIQKLLNYNDQLDKMLENWEIIVSAINLMGRKINAIVPDNTWIDENHVLVKQFLKIEKDKPLSLEQMISLLISVGSVFEKSLKEKYNARARADMLEKQVEELRSDLEEAKKTISKTTENVFYTIYVVMKDGKFKRGSSWTTKITLATKYKKIPKVLKDESVVKVIGQTVWRAAK